MASPTTYSLSYDFTSFQSSNPTTPLPADQLEIELNNVSTTTGEIITNLGLIQRSDGNLANNSVGADQLKDDISTTLNPAGNWVTLTSYVIRDAVYHGNNVYRCIESHTSGTFATDLANAKWELFLDFDQFITQSSASATASATSATASATSATASATSATSASTTYDNFDARYLGDKTVDPTLDNSGNALIDGALYFNTVDPGMKVYDLSATSWIAVGGGGSIADGSVTTAKIADEAVTTAKIADDSLTTAKHQDGSVTYDKIQDLPAGQYLGRLSVAGTGPIQDLSASAMRGDLDLYTTTEVDTEITNAIAAITSPIFTQEFESNQQTLVSAGSLTLAHGLSAQPKLYMAYIVCITAEHNYAVGDEIALSSYYSTTSSATSNGVVMIPDATNINVRVGNFFTIPDKNSPTIRSNITFSNWKLIIRAWG